MKKIIVLCVVLLFLVFYGFAEETFKNDYKISGEKILKIEMKTGGRLEVKGWKKQEIKTMGDCDWKLEWGKDGDKIELEARCNSKRAKTSKKTPVLTVLMPRKFDLEIKSQGGPISLENIEGSIHGKTLGGELKLHKLKGTLHMKTMGGGITLTDSQLDGKLTTMGGRVLFENVAGDIKGISMGGSVVYKNVEKSGGKSNGEPIRMKTMGGAIIVNHAPNGAILHTMGGKISIKSAQKFVDAKTMGGNIVVEELNGWIKASTMGGNIDVTMLGDETKGKRDVTLESKGGDIYLTIPADLSMEIQAEVTLQKGQNHESKIFSDFPLIHRVPKIWQTKNGKEIKRITATGSIAGGKHKIALKTWSGKIYIKKHK